MTTKQQLLDWHRSQLGFVEGPRSNETPYAAIAGHANFLPWCATYQVAGARECGLELPSESPWTPSILEGLRDAGGARKDPEVGALAFLYFPSMGRVAHVGIIEELRPDGRFVTIEGNTDVAGGRTGGRVMRKVRSRSGWFFAMPAYSESTPQPPDNPGGIDRELTKRIQTALKVPVDGLWGSHTDSRAIRMRTAAQAKVGWPARASLPFNVPDVQVIVGTKADGIWGPKSQYALTQWVKEFQRILGVSSDGAWGPNTDAHFMQVRAFNQNKF